ncbi:MAG TPA: DNA integrity scanning diadenylate cyclase DisA [Candidatus Paceibacterota bacterium]|nr:DNA integrity scanning diadenylate cyclase DisA [Candidatus Paceibacterota bacterium]
MEKKEKQTKIFSTNIERAIEEKTTKEEFFNILRFVAPGTNLRAALNGIVDAKKGALILVENEFTNDILDGGFKINCKFTPQKLIELSKMDGGIILSHDMKRIVYANVMLVPDVRIPTKETGTRHKAAERSAKMTGTLAIAISERKNQINIYYKDLKYHLHDTAEILRRATETLQILEKHRELFDINVDKLNKMEISNDLSIKQAAKVIQKGRTMQKILESQEKTFVELGNEASTLKLRVREIMKDVEKETDLVIRDYTILSLKKSKSIIDNMSHEELFDLDKIITALAQKNNVHLDSLKGWRILSKTCLNEKEVAEVLNYLGSFKDVLNSNQSKYQKIIGEEKAKFFNKEIQTFLNAHR